jgi:chromosome segregation ATPase
MKERPREIGVETLSTPKGDVPTIKGLETVIDAIFSEYNNINKNMATLNEAITQLSREVSSQANVLKNLSNSFADLLVQLGKLDTKIERQQSSTVTDRLIETVDLFTLKSDLSRILAKIESFLDKEER